MHNDEGFTGFISTPENQFIGKALEKLGNAHLLPYGPGSIMQSISNDFGSCLI